MAKEEIHLISGLPRSGSTLLCNLLRQNPEIFSTPTSGLIGQLVNFRQAWGMNEAHLANPDEEAKWRCMRGIVQDYHTTERRIVLDKNRVWTRHISLFEKIAQRKAKVIVCVRDVRDVLASMEKLFRESSIEKPIPGMADNPAAFNTIESRCNFWMQPTGIVGNAWTAIKDAVDQGLSNRMLFVDYDDLTHQPAVTMLLIYNFLGLTPFDHDFQNIEQVIFEDDYKVYGYKNLHDIASKIRPSTPQWPSVLRPSSVPARYEPLNFWKK